MPATVKEIFDGIQGNIDKDPAKATTVGAIYQFDVTGDGGGTWVVDLKEAVKVSDGPSPKAECTITVGAQDFLDINNSKMNPQVAFMSGKLKIKGDMSKAMKLQQVLKG